MNLVDLILGISCHGIIKDLQDIIADYLTAGDKFYIFHKRCDAVEINKTVRELLEYECIDENKTNFLLKYLCHIQDFDSELFDETISNIEDYILRQKDLMYLKWWNDIMIPNNKLFSYGQYGWNDLDEYCYSMFGNQEEIENRDYFWIKLVFNPKDQTLVEQIKNNIDRYYFEEICNCLIKYKHTEPLKFLYENNLFADNVICITDILSIGSFELADRMYKENKYDADRLDQILDVSVKYGHVELVKKLLVRIPWTEMTTCYLMCSQNEEILNFALLNKYFDVQILNTNKKLQHELSVQKNYNENFIIILLEKGFVPNKIFYTYVLQAHNVGLMIRIFNYNSSLKPPREFFNKFEISFKPANDDDENDENDEDDEEEADDEDNEWDDNTNVYYIKNFSNNSASVHQYIDLGCRIYANSKTICRCIEDNDIDFFKIIVKYGEKKFDGEDLDNLITKGNLHFIKMYFDSEENINETELRDLLHKAIERGNAEICYYLWESNVRYKKKLNAKIINPIELNLRAYKNGFNIHFT